MGKKKSPKPAGSSKKAKGLKKNDKKTSGEAGKVIQTIKVDKLPESGRGFLQITGSKSHLIRWDGTGVGDPEDIPRTYTAEVRKEGNKTITIMTETIVKTDSDNKPLPLKEKKKNRLIQSAIKSAVHAINGNPKPPAKASNIDPNSGKTIKEVKDTLQILKGRGHGINAIGIPPKPDKPGNR